MREALIILPKADNNGKPLDLVQEMLTKRLIDAFGGCTCRDATGYWKNDDGELFAEPVTECVAACEPTIATRNALHRIACDVGRAADQQAMYVRYASGDVEIVDIETDAQAAA